MGQDWFHILDYNNRYISLLDTNDCDDLYYEMKQNIQAQNTSFLWVLTRLTPVISQGGKLPRNRIVNNTFRYTAYTAYTAVLCILHKLYLIDQTLVVTKLYYQSLSLVHCSFMLLLLKVVCTCMNTTCNTLAM